MQHCAVAMPPTALILAPEPLHVLPPSVASPSSSSSPKPVGVKPMAAKSPPSPPPPPPLRMIVAQPAPEPAASSSGRSSPKNGHMRKLSEDLAGMGLQELHRAHEEYVKSSCEYEHELEQEIEQYECKLQHMTKQLTLAESDRAQLESQLVELRHRAHLETNQLHDLQSKLEESKWRIQKLEQENDELETGQRISQATIQDLEHKLELLMEQNVFLQQERDEAQTQAIDAIQRAMALSMNVRKLSTGNTSGAILAMSPEVTLIATAATTTTNSASANVTPTAPLTSGTTTSGTRRYAASWPRRKKRPSRLQFPEVVESCLHLSCTCKEKTKVKHHHDLLQLSTSPNFLDRLRKRFKWFS